MTEDPVQPITEVHSVCQKCHSGVRNRKINQETELKAITQ
jgi:hypothetical protein